jgi:hypothetical protein
MNNALTRRINTPFPTRVARLPNLIILVLAISAIVLTLSVAVQHVVYPFALEWLEDGALIQVQRILQGQPIYVAPSLEYVAFIYPPLYFYVSAMVAQFTGLSFLPLRLVSLLASVGSATIIGTLVYRHTRERIAVVAAVGLFAATYGVALGYYDLARVDALMTVLVLGGFLVVGKTRTGDLLAALLFTLAIFTKQAALLCIAPYFLYRVLTDRWQATLLVASTGILVSAGTLLLDHLHDGWYLFYTREIVGFDGALWARTLIIYIPLMISIYGFSFTIIWQARKAIPLPLLIQGIGIVGASFVGKLHPGGAENVMLPAYAVLSLFVGVSIGLKPPPLHWLLYTLQLAILLIYNATAPLAPSPAQAAHATILIERIRTIDGEVFIPTTPSLAIAAGKQPYAHLCAIQEIQGTFGGGDARVWQQIQYELHTALTEQHFAALLLTIPEEDVNGKRVVLDTPVLDLEKTDDAVLYQVMKQAYHIKIPMESTRVQSGWNTYPTELYFFPNGGTQ